MTAKRRTAARDSSCQHLAPCRETPGGRQQKSSGKMQQPRRPAVTGTGQQRLLTCASDRPSVRVLKLTTIATFSGRSPPSGTHPGNDQRTANTDDHFSSEKLPHPARRRALAPRRTSQNPENRLHLALGRGDHRRLAARPDHPPPNLTSKNPSQRARKETPGVGGTQATRPDCRATVTPRP